MNTQELVDALTSDDIVNSYFLNVYAIDQLPKRKLSQGSWILVSNCCPSFKPGIHWIVLCRDAKHSDHIEVFDSYGQHPDVYNVSSFCQRQGAKFIWYNTRQLQSVTSSVCGYYCLYYAYHRTRGHEMQSIINSFTTNQFNRNDHMVFEDVIHTYNLNKHV